MTGIVANSNPALLDFIAQRIHELSQAFRSLTNRVDVHPIDTRAHQSPHARRTERKRAIKGILDFFFVLHCCQLTLQAWFQVFAIKPSLVGIFPTHNDISLNYNHLYHSNLSIPHLELVWCNSFNNLGYTILFIA